MMLSKPFSHVFMFTEHLPRWGVTWGSKELSEGEPERNIHASLEIILCRRKQHISQETDAQVIKVYDMCDDENRYDSFDGNVKGYSEEGKLSWGLL